MMSSIPKNVLGQHSTFQLRTFIYKNLWEKHIVNIQICRKREEERYSYFLLPCYLGSIYFTCLVALDKLIDQNDN
jgi:hypothetical protein